MSALEESAFIQPDMLGKYQDHRLSSTTRSEQATLGGSELDETSRSHIGNKDSVFEDITQHDTGSAGGSSTEGDGTPTGASGSRPKDEQTLQDSASDSASSIVDVTEDSSSSPPIKAEWIHLLEEALQVAHGDPDPSQLWHVLQPLCQDLQAKRHIETSSRDDVSCVTGQTESEAGNKCSDCQKVFKRPCELK